MPWLAIAVPSDCTNYIVFFGDRPYEWLPISFGETCDSLYPHYVTPDKSLVVIRL
jgi:hypothetical protein